MFKKTVVDGRQWVVL